MKLSSVLIANRGEIACRIARTAKAMGMRTIAVHSHADRNALHVRHADEAYDIGAAAVAQSYLRGDVIIDTALKAGAHCIHPGYGFLSENADFAQACAKAGLVFVGPPPAAIRAMGLKDEAKALMEKAGVPVVPGYHGSNQEPEFLKRKAYETGYPLLIKAVAGGGGKGMRRVDRQKDFDTALQSAKREAQSSFGDDRVLIERFVTSPRHIELQVFADSKGNAVHLYERDCSLQRRHQKVIEEAPAPGMTGQMRSAMGKAAVAAAHAVGYQGAGTVEFIADGSGGLKPESFFFMEMNTRLQVEHPVTEMVTGLDLVEWQFRVAAGERLPAMQNEIQLSGHAVEARLYAEDPEREFLPSTGAIEALEFPLMDGLRIDAGVADGDAVSPYYDPMIAKVVAHGDTRKSALASLHHALSETVVAGPRTNLRLLEAIAGNREFGSGKFDTGFIDRNLGAMLAISESETQGAAALGALHLAARKADQSSGGPLSPWSIGDGWQLGGTFAVGVDVMADQQVFHFELDWSDGEAAIKLEDEAKDDTDIWGDIDATLVDAAGGVFVLVRGRQTFVSWPDYAGQGAAAGAGDGAVRSPMHGKVLSVSVSTGDKVAAGDQLAVVEAMKMEHALKAVTAGVVGEIAVKAGDQVGENAILLTLVSAEE